MTRIRPAEENCRTRVRDRINETGWWSSSAQTRDDINPSWIWDTRPGRNLSVAADEEAQHVLSVHCLSIINSRGQRTVRVVLECEEGVYYRDSISLISQIQGLLDWFGPVENWPPVRIGRPDEVYPRYTINPQF